MKHYGSRIRSVLWYGVVSTIILTAVLFSLVRATLPAADTFRGQLEELISNHLGRPVQIRTLDALLPGVSPTFILEQVTLFDEAGHEPVLVLPSLRLKLDPVASLRRLEPVLDSLTVRGLELAIERKRDGRLSVKGLELPAPATPGGGAGEWLLSRSQLALRDSRIVWHDEATGGTLAFESVDLELLNVAGRHRLTGKLHSPDGIGDSLEVALDVRGNPTRDRHWSGEGWVRGQGLRPAALAHSGLVLPVTVTGGQMDLEAWATFADGGLTGLRGEVSVDRLALSGAGRQETVEQLAARFDWYAEGEAWGISLEELHFARGGERWASPRAGLHVAGGDVLRGQAWADHLRIQDVTALLLLAPGVADSWRERLEGLAPTGDLYELELIQQGDTPEVAFSAAGLGMQPFEGVPGVSNLDLALRYRDGVAILDLEGRDAALDLVQLFAEPLRLKTLNGRVRIEQGASLWRVSASRVAVTNSDLAAVAGFDLTLQPGRSPFLSLQGQFRDVDPRRIGAYLPPHVPAPTAEWLTHAFPAGRATEGGVLFHGRLDQFPFDDGSGRFEVRLEARDVELAYAPGWPTIEAMAGTVVFDGSGMDIAVRRGLVAGNPLAPTRAAIADLRQPHLEIEGAVQGTIPGGLRFLRESPLGAGLTFLEQTDGRGPLRLDLRLDRPLGQHHGESAHFRIEGNLTFRDGELSLFRQLRLDQLQGEFAFTEATFHAERLVGRLLDRPLEASVSTDEELVTEVTLSGGLAAPALYHWSPVLHRLRGETRWHGMLRVPRSLEEAPVSLRLESDLHGLAVDLPQPLGKLTESRTRLGAEWRQWKNGVATLEVAVPERLATRLGFADGQMRAGSVHFGAGPPKPARQGEFHVSGSLHDVESEQWRRLLLDLPRGSGNGSTPLQPVVTLDTVHVNRRMSLGGSNTSPEPWNGDLPAMRLHVRRLLYGGADLGEVGFVIRKSPQLTHIDDVFIRGPLVELQGDIRRHGENAPLTTSRFRIDTPDLGRLLSELQIASAVDQGRASASGALQWSATDWLPEPSLLQGEIVARVADGRLVDVDPGAGRLLGLLSLRALPRRLFLDFSDLFQSGMGFERITASLKLEEGKVQTSDLSIRTLQAQVLMAGYTDLVNRTLDYRVRVRPDVRAGLPLAGGLVLGPQAGAALLFFQGLFRSELAEATQIEYLVKGSWEDPEVERRR